MVKRIITREQADRIHLQNAYWNLRDDKRQSLNIIGEETSKLLAKINKEINSGKTTDDLAENCTTLIEVIKENSKNEELLSKICSIIKDYNETSDHKGNGALWKEMAEEHPITAVALMKTLKEISKFDLSGNFHEAFYPVLEQIGSTNVVFAEEAIDVIDKTLPNWHIEGADATDSIIGIVAAQPTSGKKALDAITSIVRFSVNESLLSHDDDQVFDDALYGITSIVRTNPSTAKDGVDAVRKVLDEAQLGNGNDSYWETFEKSVGNPACVALKDLLEIDSKVAKDVLDVVKQYLNIEECTDKEVCEDILNAVGKADSGLKKTADNMKKQRYLIDIPECLTKGINISEDEVGCMLAGSLYNMFMRTGGDITPQEWENNSKLQQLFFATYSAARKMDLRDAARAFIDNNVVNKYRLAGIISEDNVSPHLYRKMSNERIFNEMLVEPGEQKITPLLYSELNKAHIAYQQESKKDNTQTHVAQAMRSSNQHGRI